MSGRLVLVRHGQSHANVERRLDTRPPGEALTYLGREQARTFASGLVRPPGLLAHSLARRAADRAAGSASDILRLVIPKRMVRAEKAWLAAPASRSRSTSCRCAPAWATACAAPSTPTEP